MSSDEQGIIDYLKSWRDTFVSVKEIARKVGGKERYNEDRGWVLPILAQMVRAGILETDYLGHYRLKIEEKKEKKQTHVSPQLLRILKSSGKSFEGVSFEEDDSGPPIYRKPKPREDEAKN